MFEILLAFSEKMSSVDFSTREVEFDLDNLNSGIVGGLKKKFINFNVQNIKFSLKKFAGANNDNSQTNFNRILKEMFLFKFITGIYFPMSIIFIIFSGRHFKKSYKFYTSSTTRFFLFASQ